jgi:hypothetical protein
MRNKKTAKKRAKATPPILQDFESILRELPLATKRLNDKERARWLLEFAYTDLTTLSTGSRLDLQSEVYAFGLPTDPAGLTGDRLSDVRNDLIVLTRDSDLVESFQKALRSRFDKAKTGHDWEWLQPERLKAFQLFVNVKPALGHGGRSGSIADGVEHLMAVATDLLERERDRFGVCERCEQMFAAQRKGKVRFCSPRCSAYVRVTKARGKLVA